MIATKTHYAIFDKGDAGALQWSGAYDSVEAALADFDDRIGIDPYGRGITTDDWHVYHITAAQHDNLIAWWEGDRAARAFPLPDSARC